jgi:microcystin-dependent protein
MSNPFVAEIRLFTGNFAPKGWALCSGQVLPISQNTALFSLVGTFYGGDGKSTFALPDLRSRVAVGTGQGPGLSNYVIGEQFGAESVTLTAGQLPSHTHTATVGTLGLAASSAAGDLQSPAGGVLAAEATGVTATYSSGPADTTMAAAALTGAPAIGLAGSSQPVSILQPYLALTYMIALQGVFPARN